MVVPLKAPACAAIVMLIAMIAIMAVKPFLNNLSIKLDLKKLKIRE